MRWFDQAVEDLGAATVLKDGDRFAQSCFYSQQASEKAMKALGWIKGVDLWWHSLLALSDEILKLGYDPALDEKDLAMLDRFYIPTRYPNGIPDVIPQRAFLKSDAESGIEAADRILNSVRKLVKSVE